MMIEPNPADLQLLNTINRLNFFQEADLPYNRQWKLSPTQRAVQLDALQKLTLLAVVLLAPIPVAILFKSFVTYFLAIMGGIFAPFIIYFVLQVRRNLADGICTVEGMMSRDKRVSHGRHTTITYYLCVGGRRFAVQQESYDALTWEIPVRAYYLPNGDILLNLEILTDLSTIKESPKLGILPHTNF
jgi:hypothetical protein